MIKVKSHSRSTLHNKITSKGYGEQFSSLCAKKVDSKYFKGRVSDEELTNRAKKLNRNTIGKAKSGARRVKSHYRSVKGKRNTVVRSHARKTKSVSTNGVTLHDINVSKHSTADIKKAIGQIHGLFNGSVTPNYTTKDLGKYRHAVIGGPRDFAKDAAHDNSLLKRKAKTKKS